MYQKIQESRPGQQGVLLAKKGEDGWRIVMRF